MFTEIGSNWYVFESENKSYSIKKINNIWEVCNKLTWSVEEYKATAEECFDYVKSVQND